MQWLVCAFGVLLISHHESNAVQGALTRLNCWKPWSTGNKSIHLYNDVHLSIIHRTIHCTQWNASTADQEVEKDDPRRRCLCGLSILMDSQTGTPSLALTSALIDACRSPLTSAEVNYYHYGVHVVGKWPRWWWLVYPPCNYLCAQSK